MKTVRCGLWAAFFVCLATCAAAQSDTSTDNRAQYPAVLADSYFSVNIGSMRYAFTGRQLESGFQAETIDIPHLAVRVDLFGHYFTKYLSAQVTYMRPARYVNYLNINGEQKRGQVKEAYGGGTLVAHIPLNPRVSAYAEAGWGLTSRGGFQVNGTTAMRDAHFAAGLFGGGFSYHATPTIDLLLSATYSPGREAFDQPSTRLFTTGLRYRMRTLPDAKVEATQQAGFAFPADVVRLGLATNVAGYGVNGFLSQTVPVFWGGNAETRGGLTLDFQRNIFHTKKVFAFDIGASASYWQSNQNQDVFFTLSAYPLFRFFFARTQTADMYLAYSLAGPTLISQTLIDGWETGEHFTFQDFMGVGVFLGKSRRVNAELGIKHYSNGNIFTRNAAIKIPLTLTLGMAF